jgi:hypothetical protein
VPVRFDYRWANFVGITTDNRAEARQWAIEALLLGYEVLYRSGRLAANSRGFIAEVRERARRRA